MRERAFFRVEGGEALRGSSVEERIREITGRVAQEHGLELVHVEMASVGRLPVVRIFIDKPGGVTHEDCAQVSLHVGTILDVEDFIHSVYTLEVSSPGLERGLYKREDYERFAGQLAKIKTRGAIGGQRNFRGRLVAVEGDTVVFDDRTNGRVFIPLQEIAKANTEIDVEEEFRLAEEREKEKKQRLETAGG
ncbi:MAG: ribosome maturation factor RimP [Acidobacteria bacterium]|nr:ribosome maturation factor RimP [Acidobacteriota bacterium]